MCRDTNQFLELLESHYSDALNYCRALCSKNTEIEAEEILQQSFLQALEGFEDLKDVLKFRSWMFTIITRVFYTYTRKSFWKKFVSLDFNSENLGIPQVFDRTEQNKKRIMLSKALSNLKDKERAAILLFEIGGFSLEEIRKIQKEKSISSIKSRLSRTRKKLREIINELENNRSDNFNYSSKHFTGDLEDETLKLVTEIEAKE